MMGFKLPFKMSVLMIVTFFLLAQVNGQDGGNILDRAKAYCQNAHYITPAVTCINCLDCDKNAIQNMWFIRRRACGFKCAVIGKIFGGGETVPKEDITSKMQNHAEEKYS